MAHGQGLAQRLKISISKINCIISANLKLFRLAKLKKTSTKKEDEISYVNGQSTRKRIIVSS